METRPRGLVSMETAPRDLVDPGEGARAAAGCHPLNYTHTDTRTLGNVIISIKTQIKIKLLSYKTIEKVTVPASADSNIVNLVGTGAGTQNTSWNIFIYFLE